MVAGTGAAGYSGDGAAAVNAELDTPWGVAVDTASPANVYIGDTANCLVRKVNQTTGIITTVAGKTTSADFINMRLYRQWRCSCRGGVVLPLEVSQSTLATTSTSPNTTTAWFARSLPAERSPWQPAAAEARPPATTAGAPHHTATVERGPRPISAIRKAAALDTTVSPANVFISQASAGGRCAIREVVGSSQKIYTVAGNNTCGFLDGVTATSGELNDPWQTHVSVSGGTTTIAVADYSNVRIRQFTLTYSGGVPAPGKISTIAGDGSGGYCNDGDPAIDACMSPVGLVYDSSGNYYIGDYGSDRVRKVTKSTGDISTIFGWGPNGGTQPNYSDPVGVTDVAGGNPSLYYPTGVYADPTSNNVYIGGYDGESVYKWNSGSNEISGFAGNGAAGFEGDGGPAESAATELNAPWGIARDSGGNIYLADYNNCDIREVSDSTADITTVAGGSAGHQLGCGYTTDGSDRHRHPK